jgi:hypothetical protein
MMTVGGVYRKPHPAIRRSVYAAGADMPVSSVQSLAAFCTSVVKRYYVKVLPSLFQNLCDYTHDLQLTDLPRTPCFPELFVSQGVDGIDSTRAHGG